MVERDLALLWRRVLDGADISLRMNAHHVPHRAPRRVFADQRIETRICKLSIDGADAIGPLRVMRAGVVLEARVMAEKQGAQNRRLSHVACGDQDRVARPRLA